MALFGASGQRFAGNRHHVTYLVEAAAWNTGQNSTKAPRQLAAASKIAALILSTQSLDWVAWN
ncbi:MULTISPECIES: hypothetical protein [Streptomyces]|uniref:hypothetical protein n=1 Tax=Streptomyces TaxID=1883 RepID=UPI0013924020|nr:hypothetical protein [Streptomyces noursei]MCE4942524.1 hypothetical protein [Streptomyces noursei]UWS77529.1 hypothetical protein N1H47_33610 [Streptomyces noursei]